MNTAQTPSPEDDMKKKLEYIKTPRTIDLSTYNFDPLGKGAAKEQSADANFTRVSEPVKPSGQQDNALPPMFEHDDVEYSRDDAGKRTEEYSRYSEIEEDESLSKRRAPRNARAPSLRNGRKKRFCPRVSTGKR